METKPQKIKVIYIEGDKAYVFVSENPYREHNFQYTFRDEPQIKEIFEPYKGFGELEEGND